MGGQEHPVEQAAGEGVLAGWGKSTGCSPCSLAPLAGALAVLADVLAWLLVPLASALAVTAGALASGEALGERAASLVPLAGPLTPPAVVLATALGERSRVQGEFTGSVASAPAWRSTASSASIRSRICGSSATCDARSARDNRPTRHGPAR
jgi:hypothetical protein